ERPYRRRSALGAFRAFRLRHKGKLEASKRHRTADHHDTNLSERFAARERRRRDISITDRRQPRRDQSKRTACVSVHEFIRNFPLFANEKRTNIPYQKDILRSGKI